MGKGFDIPAGQRQRVLRIFSSSILGDVRFSADPVQGEQLSGKLELHRWHWFSWIKEDHTLNRLNVLPKRFGDADYHVYVTPDQDCRVTFQTRHFRAGTYFMIIACVLCLGIVAAAAALMFASS